MTGYPSYSTTPANNVTANTGINWDEGMAPAAVNNSSRQNMTDARLAMNDLPWFAYGTGSQTTVIPLYGSGTTFTIAGIDVTAYWHVGRRVRAVGTGTGTIYGRISASAFSTNTTVTVVWDSGSLSNEGLVISAGLPATGNPLPQAGTSLNWVPIDSSGAGLTFTAITAKYSVIGNIVFFQAILTLVSTANTSTIAIGGLPFASLATIYTPVNVSAITGPSGFPNGISGLIAPATTVINLKVINDASPALYRNSDLGAVTIAINGCYQKS